MITMQFPTGVSSYVTRAGAKVVPNASGQCSIDPLDLIEFLGAGFGPVSLISEFAVDEAAIAALQAKVPGSASGTNTGDETLARVSALVQAASAKTAPVDADSVALVDSEATPVGTLKKLTWAYVKSVLKTYFDGLYQSLTDAAVRAKAMSGDMVFVIAPATKASAATNAAWQRTVTVTLKSAAAEVHTWFNKAIATGVSIADASTAGTATIPSTTLTFVNGVASVVISGNAAAWLGTETDTLTIASLTILGYTVTGGTSVETFS